MSRFRVQPAELLAVSILVSIAAFFRFFALPEKLVFQGDQGRALLAARDILSGQLTLLGPETSVSGFHLGPFFYYLIAPALWLTNYDPIGPAVLIASFGVATVLLLYFYGKRFFSWEAGFLTGLLFALSPHAIWQSRLALEPAPVPFFTVLWLYAMTSWVASKNRQWLALSAFSIFLGVQLNFSFVALLPATIWLLILSFPMKREWRRKLQILSLLTLLFFTALRVLWNPTTSWNFFLAIWTKLTLPASPVVAALLPSIFLLTFGWLLWQKGRLPKNENFLPIASWIVFCFAAFTLKTVSGEHALAVLFPAPAILAGIAWHLLQPQTVRARYLVILALSGIILLVTAQAWKYLQQKQSSFLSEYQEVTNHILELADGKAYRFVYRGHLDIYEAADDHYQYLLWQAGKPPVVSYRREITPATQDIWNNSSPEEFQTTIVLYQPPFNFNEYTGFQEAQEWNGRWFAVEEKTP